MGKVALAIELEIVGQSSVDHSWRAGSVDVGDVSVGAEIEVVLMTVEEIFDSQVGG